MNKIFLPKETQDELIQLSKDHNLFLEGNLTKLILTNDKEFQAYLDTAIELDKANRRKRLEITKQVQVQNIELQEKATENENLMADLTKALEDTKRAKEQADNDLNILQQKTQFELIGNIVNVALWIIVGVGLITTVLYGISLYTGHETQLLGNTWSNMFGILLTNSFSIIGTIMGVKYAQNDNSNKKKE